MQNQPRRRRLSTSAAVAPQAVHGRAASSADCDTAGEQPHKALDPGQLRRVLNFLGRDGPPKAERPAVRIGLIGASQVGLGVGEGQRV
jgi:hypothetical protein